MARANESDSLTPGDLAYPVAENEMRSQATFGIIAIASGTCLEGRETKKLFLLGCAILVLSGCSDDTLGPSEKPSFEVRVLTPNLLGVPVEGAWIEGGVDWTQYKVKTDSKGVGIVPGSGLGNFALIHKDGFLPRVVRELEPSSYWIAPTTMTLEHVGSISGRPIRFGPDTLLTLEYQGGYHAYSYDDTSVTELATTTLSATAIRTTRFYGDTLWLSTHDTGIFVYSVEDPLNPVDLFLLDIPGYLGSFAVRDSIVAVGDPWGDAPLRIFSYTPTGGSNQIAEVNAYNVRQMEFLSHYLAILSYDAYELSAAEFRIVDLSDAAQPRTVYALQEHGGRSGLILNGAVLIGPNWSDSDGLISYTTLDLSDPEHPVYIGRTWSDSWLSSVAGDSSAAGHYCLDLMGCDSAYRISSVLSGTLGEGFHTVATVSDAGWNWPGPSAPPYFVVGYDLWRLTDR